MIVYLPMAGFVVGMVLAYRAPGRRRQLGTILMLLASAWALALLGGPAAAAWAIGGVLGTLMLRRPEERAPLAFEALTRRALTIAALLLLAVLLVSRLPFGENPLLLDAVPWFLGAVGAAWLLSPLDERERLQGQVFMVAAAGALLLAALPAGPATSAAAGGAAIVPAIASQVRTPGRARPLLSSLAILAAGLLALIAAINPTSARAAIADVSIDLAGPLLLGIAIVLLAGSLLGPVGSEWAALLGVLSLLATAPALRWAALAALIAVATSLEREAERPAWLGFGLLAAIPLLQSVAPPLWSTRVQAVALGAGVVLTLYAARAGMLRVLVLPTTAILSIVLLESLSTGNLTRFQWIAVAGCLLLIGRTVLLRPAGEVGRVALVSDQLLLALLLLAISARDGLGLGALAAALLSIALAVVRIDFPEPDRPALVRQVAMLARSNWPPSITFAAGTLTVIAALQASLALGLVAAVILACLQLAPLIDRRRLPASPERLPARASWLPSLLSIACGLAPALLLRMLRL